MRTGAPPREEERTILIPTDSMTLAANLSVPERALGIVLFAHGSGSSRHSPRNRRVARILREGRLGTLLLDLLTSDEEQVDFQDPTLRFDIDLLAKRLVEVSDWVATNPQIQGLPIGYFGASTGSAAALVAAANRPDTAAVVSRGGRPDLAGADLSRVQAPVLFIVGGNDQPVITLNREAVAKMRCLTRLEIIEGATHLFEEPGALDQVSVLARDWFLQHRDRDRGKEGR
jgi:putative phosphoribosyl transferase